MQFSIAPVLMTDWLFAYFYFAARLFVPGVAHKTSFDCLDEVEGRS